ncbi:hypothetical protein BDN71DRAFT_929605 [Pleurotus eryngii]|uniref:Uncharacterized protein n=1 Tax=Pleurotus eryngii TaxID=5323 RepID=A0A9P5ZWB7_PLEER|nr:hypothetical protein BDN71DRAFT_929605 [Pleurotus eryngii]
MRVREYERRKSGRDWRNIIRNGTGRGLRPIPSPIPSLPECPAVPAACQASSPRKKKNGVSCMSLRDDPCILHMAVLLLSLSSLPRSSFLRPFFLTPQFLPSLPPRFLTSSFDFLRSTGEARAVHDAWTWDMGLGLRRRRHQIGGEEGVTPCRLLRAPGH